MLDLLRKDIAVKARDPHISNLLDTDAASNRLSEILDHIHVHRDYCNIRKTQNQYSHGTKVQYNNCDEGPDQYCRD